MSAKYIIIRQITAEPSQILTDAAHPLHYRNCSLFFMP